MDGLLAIRWFASESWLIQRLLAFDYVPIVLHDRHLFFRYSYCPQGRGIAQFAKSVEWFLRGKESHMHRREWLTCFSMLTAVGFAGCRGYQYGHVIKPGTENLVGSHEAGAEVFDPLVDEAVAKFLARQQVSPEDCIIGPDGFPVIHCGTPTQRCSGRLLLVRDANERNNQTQQFDAARL